MKLSIATKIFVAFAAVIVIFMAVLTFGIYRTQSTYDQIEAVNQSAVPLSLILSDVQTDLKSFSLILNEKDPLVLRRTLQVTRLAPSVPERLRKSMKQALEIARAARLGAFGVAVESDLSNRLKALDVDINGFADQAEALTQTVLNEEPEADAAQLQAALRAQSRGLDSRLSVIRNDLRVATSRGLAEASRLKRASTVMLGGVSLVALAIAVALLIAVLFTMRRLTALTEAAKRIGEGDYSPLARPDTAQDEIGTLTREFNHMAKSIAERDQALRDQHAKLLQSERLATVGRMTSLITHELRNPLSSINLNTEMLAEALVGSTAAEEDPDLVPVLETIISEVDRLRDITEEYLVYARLPSPKLKHHDLNDTLVGIADFHGFEWSHLNVEVTLNLAAKLFVKADPGQIRQAFLNLMKNAVEASAPNSVVDVVAVRNNDGIRIEVIDHAGGIPNDVRPHIFEPFYTTKQSGTGLGLAMTQEIIEEHRGTLTFESTHDGTRFIVTLPSSP